MKLQFDALRIIPMRVVLSIPPKKYHNNDPPPKKQLMILQTLVSLITRNGVSDFRWRSAQFFSVSPR